MPPSKERSLNYEAIKQLCEKLVLKGYKDVEITFSDIVGRTVVSKVESFRQRWLKERQARQQGQVEPTEEYVAGVSAMLNFMREHKSAERQTFEAAAASNSKTIVRLEADLKEALERNMRLDDYCQHAHEVMVRWCDNVVSSEKLYTAIPPHPCDIVDAPPAGSASGSASK